MPIFRPSGPWRYALSIATVAAAVLLAWPLRPLQDISTPLFVLTVLVSAWYGGPGPAVLTAILSVVAAARSSSEVTPRGGHILLNATSEDGTLVLRVRDNGIGIPSDMVDRVFEMFTQADRSASRTHGGLGIGLSLVRGLVEAHGGTVTAASDGPGKGREIVVHLPTQGLRVPEAHAPAL